MSAGDLRTATTEVNIIHTERTPEIVCPHCGYVFGSSDEYHSDDGIADCPECDRELHYERMVDVSYTTRPVEACRFLDNHGMDCSWDSDAGRPDGDAMCPRCPYETHRRAQALEMIRGGRT